MQIEARISQEWRRRMIFMGIMIWGSALWFASDGYLVWPAEAERYRTLEALTAGQVPEDTKLTDKNPDVKRIWETHARENDLKKKVPKNRTAGDLAGQRGIAGFLTLIGVTFTAWVVRQHRRSVKADGEIITGASGERVPFDDIVEMDRRKWTEKGIAYGIYFVDGKRRKLCLDDHKFLGCEAIILEAERRIKARAESESASGESA